MSFGRENRAGVRWIWGGALGESLGDAGAFIAQTVCLQCFKLKHDLRRHASDGVRGRLGKAPAQDHS